MWKNGMDIAWCPGCGDFALLDAGFFEQGFNQAALQRFTGDVDRVYGLRQTVDFQQRLECRWNGVDQTNIVFAVLQLQDVFHHLDAAARSQGCEALVDRQVEVQRGREQCLG